MRVMSHRLILRLGAMGSPDNHPLSQLSVGAREIKVWRNRSVSPTGPSDEVKLSVNEISKRRERESCVKLESCCRGNRHTPARGVNSFRSRPGNQTDTQVLGGGGGRK